MGMFMHRSSRNSSAGGFGSGYTGSRSSIFLVCSATVVDYFATVPSNTTTSLQKEAYMRITSLLKIPVAIES